jgi:hypothetical protein
VDVVHAFAGLVVSDLSPARDWYAAPFGREADIVPNESDPDGNQIHLIHLTRP